MTPDASPWINASTFAAAAVVVWLAGSRIARYADEIATTTGLGHAVVGMLLLGGVTSLPELAVASTAALSGHPGLSVNDVLGSASINVLVIALADAAIGRDAITSSLASTRVLLQGVLGIILPALAAAASVSTLLPPPVMGEVGPFAAVGALLAIVLTALFLAGMLERRDRTVLRMGWDSLGAIAIYLGALVVLYRLR